MKPTTIPENPRHYSPLLALAAAAVSLLIGAASSRAQVPDTLISSIPAPLGNVANANFGASVAVDTTYTAVGIPNDDTRARNAGSVKVFETGTGTLRFVVPHPAPHQDEAFGSAVAISGTRLVVGAPQFGVNSPFRETVGIVYVFDLAGSNPTVPVATLEYTGRSGDARFGTAVAISGTRALVGAPFDDARGADAGVAYMFDLTANPPELPIGEIASPSPRTNDRFGSAVALAGTLAMVGAPQTANEGRVFGFDLTSGVPAAPFASLTNPAPAAGDAFGAAVVLDGRLALVGAPGDGTGASGTGSAFLFDLSASAATPIAIFRNPAPAAGDRFGAAVALSGGRLLIGAPLDDAGATDSGTVYVYVTTSTVPRGIINNPNPAANDVFGTSIAMIGQWAVVGVPLDDRIQPDAGDAYFYKVTDISSTSPLGWLNDATAPVNDRFGSSVSITSGAFSDNDIRIVVGVPGDDTGATDAGGAYVYAGSTPSRPQLTFTNPSPAIGDFFGNAVTASRAFIAIGARGDDSGEENAGLVYSTVFDRPRQPTLFARANPNPGRNDGFGNAVAAGGTNGTTLVVGAYRALSTGKVYAGTVTLNNPSGALHDEFGISVAISGTRVAVGAHLEDTGSPNAGSAYVYELSRATPELPVWTFHNPDPAHDDRFGAALAISGTRVVIGAPYDDTGAYDAGSAYVFDVSSATPTVPVVVLRNPYPGASDAFGSAVAIAGTTVVVGAPADDSCAPNAGIAYVYDLTSSTPSMPVATLVSPAPRTGDAFGNAVAIDRSTAVIGAPLDDSAGLDQGAVYVFGPDVTGPVGGTVTLSATTLEPGATGCVFFAGWADIHTPLTYVVLVDDVPVNTPTTSTTIHFTAPTSPGVHRLTGCIFDARGNVTEVPRNFTVKGAAEIAPKVFPAPGTSVGLVGEGGTDGYLQATIQRTGAVTAQLDYQGKTYAVSGKLDGSGVLTKSFSRSGKPPLQVRLRADWSGPSGVITADVTDGGTLSAVTLKRSGFTAANPAPQAGRYTILIESDPAAFADSSAQPLGYGSGIVVVAPTGRVGFAGRLADGSRVSHATWLSESGTWPLYIPLYGGAGAVSGSVTFRDRAELTDLDGGLTWQRPALRNALFYKDGFTAHVALGGSRFTALPSAFTQQQLEVMLSAGNLPTLKTARVPAFSRNVTRSGDLVLSVDATNGLLTGSFLHPVTRTRQPIFGAILSKLGMAAGYFPGKNQTGEFELSE